MADASATVLNDAFNSPGVNVYFFYNSAIKTVRTIEFRDGWNESYQTVWGEGDGVVSKEGFEYACGKWRKEAKGNTVICHDLNSPNDEFNHGMLAHPVVMDIVWKAMTSDEWTVGGGHSIKGTDTEGWSNFTKRS
jgi:hypothetical protein